MRIREGCPDDFEFYYQLKCEPTSIYWGGFKEKPDYDNLLSHFNKLITGKIVNREFFIIDDDNEKPVGYLQLSHNSESEIEIGYGVSEKETGKGYGTYIIEQAQRIVNSWKLRKGKINLIGYIRDDNIASKRCFEKNGFIRQDKYDKRFFAMDNDYVKMYLFVWTT